MEYAFHVYNKLSADGIAMGLDDLLQTDCKRKLTPKKFLSSKEEMQWAGMRSKKEIADFCKSYTGQLPPPVVVCVGSDLAIGDSLGPLVGSLLKYKTQGLGVYIYGTLKTPVTAKEIKVLREFLRQTHKGSQIICVDAAVGEAGDIGLVRLLDAPLSPGAGANKNLGKLGDVSVLGIVAEKSVANYGLFNQTRLNLVYMMAEAVSEGIANLLWQKSSAVQKQST